MIVGLDLPLRKTCSTSTRRRTHHPGRRHPGRPATASTRCRTGTTRPRWPRRSYRCTRTASCTCSAGPPCIRPAGSRRRTGRWFGPGASSTSSAAGATAGGPGFGGGRPHPPTELKTTAKKKLSSFLAATMTTWRRRRRLDRRRRRRWQAWPKQRGRQRSKSSCLFSS